MLLYRFFTGFLRDVRNVVFYCYAYLQHYITAANVAFSSILYNMTFYCENPSLSHTSFSFSGKDKVGKTVSHRLLYFICTLSTFV